MTILAIDAGTTGVTAQLVDVSGNSVGRGYSEFEQHFPQPGWVEHKPEQIWQATIAAVTAALTAAGRTPNDVTAIGITNQRETVALWDRATLACPTNAIVWQDRRTADLLNDQRFAEAAGWVRQTTGLPLDPYFSSSKLLWIKRNLPEVWAGVEGGRLAIGTIDSYLVARITGGASHITDASNASRTQLFNLKTLGWDQRLLDLFEVPASALPTVTANFGMLAHSDPSHFLGIDAPITGMAGDQQAALFGQLAVREGDSKCTYGTGAFLLRNTGSEIVNTDPRLIATVAWVSPDGSPTYALEGAVFVAGAAIQWLRDGLQMVSAAGELEPLARTVEDNGGVYFIPALTGLGSPFWDPQVRGTIFGITRGTERGHFARATFEAIAFQVRSLIEAMNAAVGYRILELKTDGGVVNSPLMLQTQADSLGIPVARPANLDTTGMGAAYLAGLGAGIWANTDDLAVAPGTMTAPTKPLDVEYQIWLRAVAAARRF
jgi:glycerol kinase